VYPTVVANINNLKNRIEAAIAAVDIAMMQHMWLELEYCLDIVCMANSAHVECVSCSEQTLRVSVTGDCTFSL
jgi:hypothetical protein